MKVTITFARQLRRRSCESEILTETDNTREEGQVSAKSMEAGALRIEEETIVV